MRSFSSGGIRPCIAATRRSGQLVGGELGDDLLDRREGRAVLDDALVVVRRIELADLELVAADARADDVDLVALPDLLTHPGPDPVHPARVVEQVDHGGLDRGAARRQLGERRDLEVAEDRHRDGARDRRRGHHQHVRRRPERLVGERGALLDAEPVLLVDHDQAEVEELDLVLQQGVGADHDPGLADRETGQRLGALGLGHRAGEQLDVRPAHHPAGRQVAEHRGDRAVVLLGQHLGGRQQRGLAAGVDDAEHRAQRDQGLAGADLTLEQPVHRMRLGEVGLDLGADLQLAGGQGRTAAARRRPRAGRPLRRRAPGCRVRGRTGGAGPAPAG